MFDCESMTWLSWLIIFDYGISESRESGEGKNKGKIYIIGRCCDGRLAPISHRLEVAFLLSRVSNIYDLNPTTYIFKIARSEEKYQLLVENGVRFHITEQKPDKKTIPSGFTMKFRRFLRSKRIESIRQVGVERVVVISFGTEAFSNHIILELYSQGNIILTDQNYKILQCIRSHEFNDKAKTAVGEVYPFEHAANIYL